MINKQQIPYIFRGGDLAIRHPFMLEHTHMRCFFMDANRAKLQTLCDKLFNNPTNHDFHFRPLSNTVMLAFAQIKKAYSLQDAHHGSMAETDVAFWIPLLYRQNGRLKLTWYIHYIFVDNHFAMAAGREIYGFPKSLAQFQIPAEPMSANPYWVDCFSLESFGPEARYQSTCLFELRQSFYKRRTTTKPFQTAHHLFSNFLNGPEQQATRRQLRQQYWHNIRHKQHVSILFLRQLRDIQDANRAAYQEILEAPATLTKFRGGGFLPNNYRLHLFQNASYPIGEELGLQPDGHPIKSAFWVNFDFRLDKGNTMWSSGHPTINQPSHSDIYNSHTEQSMAEKQLSLN